MADVFSRQVDHGGSFSSDAARLTFGTDFGLGMLMNAGLGLVVLSILAMAASC